MRFRLLGIAAAVAVGAVPLDELHAQQSDPVQGPPLPISTVQVAQNAPVAPTPATTEAACTGTPDPYKNYACLDSYLGTNPFERFFKYYQLEWGQSGPPTDPNAPPGRRADWDPAPQSTPPMPFTDWPYGGTTALGGTRTGSADSPLMVAIANTGVGQLLQDTGIQIYGWVDPGGNVSTNPTKRIGNAPLAYAAYPNTVQLDQAVIYVDRFPDTVQKDHIDWGLRLSAIYGENYRYTTSYGLASYQLLKYNNQNGYDFPMLYGELFIPQVAEGLMIRVGRYISVPDIEAQLAPNNYMYTHSLTYTYDNYTNEGIMTSTAITPHLIVQLGVADGTEAAITNVGARIINPAPSPLYPGGTFYKDPGAQIPTYTACIRYDWNGGNDDVQPCMNGINSGKWGYNNLQWYGLTYYHKWNDKWHLSFEFYHEHEDGVPNINNPNVANGTYTTPFSQLNFNSPTLAHCANATVLRCNAYAMGSVIYLNYSPDPLNNFSFRPEIYYDPQGQRTGTPATYWEVSLGWQHWLSPQVEMRPEIGYYHSNGANAFNVGKKDYTAIAAGDLIWHF
jgi:Putative beta-barrel porin-2, OmpL-like. bbp2